MFQKLLACAAGVILIAVPASALDWTNPDHIVEAALAAAPSLREISAQLAAARARERAAGALPNPMLMAGVQNQQIDFGRDPMTMYMAGASQTFVRRQRRESLQHAAALEVQKFDLDAQSRRSQIRRDVLVAYHEAATAENQITANEEIASLAALTADAAKARYEVGAAAQIDIIRAKLESSKVRHQVLMQRGRRDAALAQLRALLQLSPGESIPPLELHHSMEPPPVVKDVTLPSATPAIAALEIDVARAEDDIRLARLATKPDFSIEASYGFRPRERDMISVVARIELPIRKATTIAPRIAEAIARRDVARAQIDVLRQHLASDLGAALASRNEALEQIDLHITELAPEAKLAFESAIGAYQAGKTTFDAVLSSLQTYRMLNVDYFDFVRQLLIADAEIEALRKGAAGRSAGASMGGGQ